MLGIVGKKLAEGAQDRFFSQAARSAENLQRKTGNAAGFKNDLTGKGQVKPDELKAMGFDEHFGDRKDITKEEVQQFINDNQVQIKETLLSNAEGYRRGTKFGDYTLDGGDNYRELLLQKANTSAKRRHPDQDELDELNAIDPEDIAKELRDQENKIKKRKTEIRQKLKEYRQKREAPPQELLVESGRLSMKITELDDEISDAVGNHNSRVSFLDNKIRTDDLNLEKSETYQSGHFDEPNILAHLRMKDRVDADGNKTLLIEEAQSDWHQTGADRGYVNNAEYADLVSEEQRLNKIVDGTNMNGLDSWGAENAPELAEAITKARVELNAGRNLAFDDPLLDHTEMMEPLHANLRKAKSDLDDAFQADYLKRNGISAGDAYMQAQSDLNLLRAEIDPMRDAVPDAPFKTDDKSSWYNLAMKRGLIEAAEGDYDKLAFTTGRQQAERYDLSKQINEVRLGSRFPDSGYTVSAFDKNDSPVIMQSIDSLDALPNLIGKDAAKSLVDQPLTDSTSGKVKILAGQDLSVGGEGMKQFYDRTLPNTLNKLVKQDGVKVGQTTLNHPRVNLEGFNMYEASEIQRLQDLVDRGRASEIDREYLANYLARAKPSGDTVHSIDITPEMRDRVKKGLPLFAQGGAVVGAGALFSPDQAHANIMAEDQKLREMGSSSYGKVSPELAEYRRSQLLPSIGEIGMGALEATVDGLDFLSNVPTSISRMQMQNNTPVRDMMQGILDTTFVDERDKRRREEARKVGALFSPI